MLVTIASQLRVLRSLHCAFCFFLGQAKVSDGQLTLTIAEHVPGSHFKVQCTGLSCAKMEWDSPKSQWVGLNGSQKNNYLKQGNCEISVNWDAVIGAGPEGDGLPKAVSITCRNQNSQGWKAEVTGTVHDGIDLFNGKHEIFRYPVYHSLFSFPHTTFLW